ncbi:MAG: hypothetical protein HQK65_23550 [Desulfamplus sp.]|nr:hypothetical protein [Desulfamplus sp.]
MARFLIIHTDGNTYNNPTLKCIIDLLKENNGEIDIRYPVTNAPMPNMPGVRLLPYGKILHIIKQIILDKIYSKTLAFLSIMWERLIYYRRYDLIIAVDRHGLIEAGILFQLTRTPVVYFSFEIMFACETSHAFKQLEKKASKFVSYWFVQDEIRAKCLEIENGMNPSSKSLLPLASCGPGHFGSKRLRDKLRIPPHKHVAIIMGSLCEWTMTREIIASVATWPEEWVLVVHERYGLTGDAISRLCIEKRTIDTSRIYFSDSSETMIDEMGFVLSGVSVGIAFYRPDYKSPYTGKNLKYLGLASGKISTFMRYGIPILTNEIGTYADLIRKHHLGMVVDHPRAIGRNLPTLIGHSFRDNARRFFDENLDFNIFRNDVWKKISSIIVCQSKSLRLQ